MGSDNGWKKPSVIKPSATIKTFVQALNDKFCFRNLISTFLKNVNMPLSTIDQQFSEGIEPLFGNDFF